jgi:hypothetical protein
MSEVRAEADISASPIRHAGSVAVTRTVPQTQVFFPQKQFF